MNFYSPFLTTEQERATISDIIRHVDYIADFLGSTGSIAIGTDYDGIPFGPIDLEDISRMPRFTAALVEAGYTGSDLEGILGGNALRVIGTIGP